MLNRRGVMALIAAGAAVSVARPASACDRDEPSKDKWGARLQDFFRSGDTSLIRGHLSSAVTLITFNTYYFGNDQVAYSGPADVESALVRLRRYLAEGSSSHGKIVLRSASLSGSGNQMGTNKITPIFGLEKEVVTSCGPTNFGDGVDLLYEDEGAEPGDENLPNLRRFAVLPVM